MIIFLLIKFFYTIICYWDMCFFERSRKFVVFCMLILSKVSLSERAPQGVSCRVVKNTV